MSSATGCNYEVDYNENFSYVITFLFKKTSVLEIRPHYLSIAILYLHLHKNLHFLQN